MAKPVDKEYRAAILNAFDTKLQLTVKEVYEYLVSVGMAKDMQSTRRMLVKMTREGLVQELPRINNHVRVYTKLMANSHLRLINYDGETVSLLKFLAELNDVTFSPIFSDNVQRKIKSAICDYLAGQFPEPYEAKNREVPDVQRMEKALQEVVEGTRLMHMFIKRFLDTPVDKSKLVLEFKTTCAEQHAAIVDRTFP